MEYARSVTAAEDRFRSLKMGHLLSTQGILTKVTMTSYDEAVFEFARHSFTESVNTVIP